MVKLEIFCIFWNILLYICFCGCGDVEDNAVFETTSQNKLNFGQLVSSNRYLIYDVNPGEGFNIRLDFYIIVSKLIKFLNAYHHACIWSLVFRVFKYLYCV